MNSLRPSVRNAANAVSNANTASGGWLWFGLYLVAALVALYMLYNWMFAPAERMEEPLAAAREATPAEGSSSETLNFKTRVAGGGEFTLSTWLYLDATGSAATANKARPVLTLSNSKTLQDWRANSIAVALYPNNPHLMVRVRTQGAGATAGSTDYTVADNFRALLSSPEMSAALQGAGMDHPLCDVFDMDLQRWTLVTLVFSGRVVDVYVDGKLSRSCVLPGVPDVRRDGDNAVTLYRSMGGRYSNVRLYNAALTPDRVWALYAAGPSAGGPLTDSFAGYVASKLGISIAYLGSGGAQKTVG